MRDCATFFAATFAIAATRCDAGRGGEEPSMADSVYRVTEVIGVSAESWEAAARSAVETAAKTVRDVRIAEVIRQDLTIENGSIVNFRIRLGISFKYERE
jgi:flavin-binding protein dodecin